MLTIHFLGTGAAVPSPGRDNTSLAIDDGREVTLIDTSGSPLKRLAEAGIAADRLSRVIITHEHLDHTFGYPSLLQSLWLSERQGPLDVYALPSAWGVIDRLAALYRADSWKGRFEIRRHVIEPEGGPVVETSQVSIRARAGQHAVPSIGLRFESPTGRSLTYSSDTSPCESIRDMASGSNVLIHEATFLAGNEGGAGRLGHSTSRQAAEVAVAAAAERLVLIHFTPHGPNDLAQLRRDAEAGFSGPIDVPSDTDTITL
jgi:ribonuclease Z